jgi:DNA-binding SARP family transcriptional activator
VGATRVLAVRLLGPLEVSIGGGPVPLTTGRLRTLLAVLAMSAGGSVSVDRLAAALWDGDLPADVRRTITVYVTRLRSLLGAERIGTTSVGYVLRAGPDQVDALRFLDSLRAAAAAPDRALERSLLVGALALWRGAPFEGLRSAWLEDDEAPRLVEAYLAAVERRVDLDLAEDRLAGLVPLLRELVAHHPLRESLWVRLLVVLARCGRQAEAVERYEMVRLRLAEELGVDPGAELRRVHADLLAGRAPELGDGARSQLAERPPPRGPVPRQLPAAGEDLCGREAELASLAELFGDDASMRPAARVCVISGMAGAGKSALAVHWAHRLAGRFGDGELYADLRGMAPRPLEPLKVLGRFLRALGADAATIPTDVEEASAAFRSQVAGRRLLLVLDDAAGATQVAPLLPASPGCAVLVTSRRALPGLEGAAQLRLGVLEPAGAVALLGHLAGEDRVAAEPAAAVAVARSCGWLPLALRAAGARLAARPTWPVAALAERLAEPRRRLDELELGGTGVRAGLEASWQCLRAGGDPSDRTAATAFALLGALAGGRISVPLVARLLRVPDDAAEHALERLVDAHLLETPAPGRYLLHGLPRLYARELAGTGGCRRPARSVVEAAPQPAHALVDALGGDGAVAHHQPRPRRSVDAVHRQRQHLHAGRGGAPQHRVDPVGGQRAGGGGDVQAGDGWDDLQVVGEPVGQGADDLLVAGLVDVPHLADVPGQPALVDEPGQRRLRGQRGVPVGHELRGLHGLAQRGGDHHEAKAQRGQHGLGERADVDDPPAGVERPQRLDGAPAVAELAVVVVLDDGGVVALRPRQQGHPP